MRLLLDTHILLCLDLTALLAELDLHASPYPVKLI